MSEKEGGEEEQKSKQVTSRHNQTSPYLSFDLLGGGGVATSFDRLSNSDLTSIRWSSECWGQLVDLGTNGREISLHATATNDCTLTNTSVYVQRALIR